MYPFDLRCKIQDALKGIDGVELTGVGSMMIPPYTADISVKVGNEHFQINIDKTGDGNTVTVR